jgi:hypothetical protein
MTPELDVHALTFKDLDVLAKKQGRKGHVAAASADGTAGQLHWTQSGTTGRAGTINPWDPLAMEHAGRTWNQNVRGETLTAEQRMLSRLHENLPPVVRRSKEQRFEVLFRNLVEIGLKGYRIHGYPVWPASIQRKLTVLGFKERDPDVYGQCSALARQLFVEAGHKQQEKDQKKIALDWHGHLNHVAGGVA